VKPETKIKIRRVALRWLRKLLDLADDRLHAAEVRFRDEQADRVPVHLEVESTGAARSQRRSKTPRRRMTAADFDLKFSR